MYDIEGYAYSVHECMYIVDVIYAHIGCIYRFLMTVAKKQAFLGWDVFSVLFLDQDDFCFVGVHY